jgi:hypothetical protein
MRDDMSIPMVLLGLVGFVALNCVWIAGWYGIIYAATWCLEKFFAGGWM